MDRWLGTSPILTLIGLALGLAAAGYSLYELATLGVPNRGHFGKASKPGQHSRDG